MTPPSAISSIVSTTPSDSPSEDSPKYSTSSLPLGEHSVNLGVGYGARDMNNGQGMDHDGVHFSAAVGPNFRFLNDRFKVSPQFKYDYQSLNKDLGEKVKSEAEVHAFCGQVNLGVAILPKWLSVHGVFAVGAALYSSPDTKDGEKGGTEFNKNAQKMTLDGTALRIEPGAALCTGNSALCLVGSYAIDSGLSITQETIDGGPQTYSVNPVGMTLGVTVDPLAIIGLVK